MRLLRAMLALQASQGAVTDTALRQLADAERVPLHRLQGLRSFYPLFRTQPGPPVQVQVCRDVVCRMRGGNSHCAAVREALADQPQVEVSEVSCLGLCDQAPVAVVNGQSITGPATVVRNAAVEGITPPIEPPPLARSWPTDPYRQGDRHYEVLHELLAAGSPDTVIQTLSDANLRGLGGAAFPTGSKWSLARKAVGDSKYVICNADESEPGTFKDRVLLEQLPHLVIEGMAVAAWTIGADRGIVYLRHEYEQARQALQQEIDSAYARGALGANIFDSDFQFDVEIFVSPGGYILGEETALLEALEDKRGEPRNKPPFPTDAGLHGKPTVINNVETLAAVPIIVKHGADWWSAQGKDGYAGLKYVSVSGDVERPGVYCVPWGSSAREVLALCGGMVDGKPLKAYSPGGASTPFLPAELLDTPLDFEAMSEAGSSLGTGAMVFVAADRDLLDIALAQLRFFRNESCGKCVPCRIGSSKAVAMVEQAIDGHGAPATDLAALHETLVQTSICGLGQVALLPLVDALRKFPEEPSLQQLRSESE